MQLARSLARGVDDDRAAAIWARAGGLPFWIDGLARSADVAESLFDRLYGRRIAALGADGSMALAALVVVARPVTPAQLARCCGWPSARTEAAIGDLVDSGVVTAHAGTVRLIHDLVREQVAHEVEPAVARELHRSWAGVFEDGAGHDLQLLRSAMEHRLAAHMPVADLALAVAVSPQRRLLGRDGARELAHLAEGLEDAAPARLELVRAIATLAAELGDAELSLSLWSVAAEEATDPGGPRHGIGRCGSPGLRARTQGRCARLAGPGPVRGGAHGRGGDRRRHHRCVHRHLARAEGR